MPFMRISIQHTKLFSRRNKSDGRQLIADPDRPQMKKQGGWNILPERSTTALTGSLG